MSLNVVLLRSSFELVAEKEPEVMVRFYENLFSMHPQAKPLFANTAIEDQQKMLLEALVAVIENLEDPEWLTLHLKLLGRRHVEYGVQPEMYDWVGEALLKTLEQAAGSAWSDELYEAWATAYGAIVELMRAGEAHAV